MDIIASIKSVALNLHCPEIAERKTISIVCNLISRFNKLETEEAYRVILGTIPGAIQAWKDGKAHNVSSAVYSHGKFALRSAVHILKKKENQLEVISLDAVIEEGNSLHETIKDEKTEGIDWQDAFNYFLSNAGFTERETEIFLGLREGKTLDQIGESFGVSRQAIYLSKKAIQTKVMRIKSKVMG